MVMRGLLGFSLIIKNKPVPGMGWIAGVAVVAELADAPDLGSGRRLCGFKSHQPHAV